jgi:hypothetical protein
MHHHIEVMGCKIDSVVTASRDAAPSLTTDDQQQEELHSNIHIRVYERPSPPAG